MEKCEVSRFNLCKLCRVVVQQADCVETHSAIPSALPICGIEDAMADKGVDTQAEWAVCISNHSRKPILRDQHRQTPSYSTYPVCSPCQCSIQCRDSPE